MHQWRRLIWACNLVFVILGTGFTLNSDAQTTASPPAAESEIGPDPALAEAYQELRAAAVANDWGRVVTEADRLLERAPKDRIALKVRGMAEMRLNRPQEAAFSYAKATELDPWNPAIRQDLCWALILADEPSEARRHCQLAVDFAPNSFANTVNLGHTYLLAGDRSTAWSWYQKTLLLLDSGADLQAGPLADFALFVKKGWQPSLSQEAADWFKAHGPAIDPDPASVSARYEALREQARQAERSKNWPALLDHADAMLALRPDDLRGLFWRGVANIERQQAEAAIAALTTLTARAPADVRARIALCRALVTGFRAAEALDQCAVAVKLAPRNFAGQLSLAHAILLAGNAPDAYVHYDRAIGLLGDEEAKNLGGPESSDDVVADLERFVQAGQQPKLAHDAKAWFQDRVQRWKVGLASLLSATSPRTSATAPDQPDPLRQAQQIEATVEQQLGGDHIMTGAALAQLSIELVKREDYKAAAPIAHRAALIAEQADASANGKVILVSMMSLWFASNQLGQYGDAITVAQKALALSDAAYGPVSLTGFEIRKLLGITYKTVGACNRAIPLFEDAQGTAARVYGPDSADAAVLMNFVSSCQRELGDYAQALPAAQRSLAILDRGPPSDQSGVLPVLNNLADIFERLDMADQALPIAERALDLSRRLNGPGSEASVMALADVATYSESAGQLDRAYALIPEILERSAPLQNPALRFGALRQVARVYRARGDKAAAIFYAKEAVNLMQSIRGISQNLDPDLKNHLVDDNRRIYEDLSSWLIEAGRLAEAEQVLSLLKDQELFELTRDAQSVSGRPAESTMDGPEATMDREFNSLQAHAPTLAEVNELAALDQLFHAPGATLSVEQAKRRSALFEARKQWSDAYEKFLAGLQPALSSDPAAAAEKRDAVAATTSNLRTLLESAKAQSGLRQVALSYVVTDESLSVILTTSEGSFAHQTAIHRSELYGRVNAFRAVLLQPSRDPRPAAKALYTLLLDPVAADLAQLAPHILVLNLTGVLRYVPFAALYDGEHYLVQRYALALYTSAGNVAIRSQSTGAWRVSGLGLTHEATVEDLRFRALPSVADELAAVVKTGAHPDGALPGQVLLDGAFTRASFEESLLLAGQGQAPVMHLASHFHLVPGAGALSGSYLVLGDGQPLRLGDIQQMSFRGIEMLTLSACDTARIGGRNENGAEVEGLAATVQSRGAQTVLATLWPVVDGTTATLMQQFYRLRTASPGEGMTHATALQRAQRDLLEGHVHVSQDGLLRAGQDTPRSAIPLEPGPGAAHSGPPTFTPPSSAPFAHPYYWAPFVLMGNWL